MTYTEIKRIMESDKFWKEYQEFVEENKNYIEKKSAIVLDNPMDMPHTTRPEMFNIMAIGFFCKKKGIYSDSLLDLLSAVTERMNHFRDEVFYSQENE